MRNLLSTITPESVLNGMVEECAKPAARSLKVSNILKKISYDPREDGVKFKSGMLLSIDSNINKSDCFNDNIKIMKTLRRNLTPGSKVSLNISEHFEEGININALSKIKNNNLPSGLFFIVESFGDSRGVAIDHAESLKYNGYSPVSLRFDYTMSTEFIASEEDEDTPLVIREKDQLNEFQDSNLIEEWYPDREVSFNIDSENLCMQQVDKTKCKYILETGNEIEELNKDLELESINDMLEKANQHEITEDDSEINTYGKIKKSLANVKNALINRGMNPNEITDYYLDENEQLEIYEEEDPYADSDEIIDLDKL